MAWTKQKTAVIVGIGLVLAAGSTEVAVKHIERFRYPDSLWGNISRDTIDTKRQPGW